MKDTEYAFAVANIRAKEPEMLTLSFMEQLVMASSFSAVKRLLVDKGLHTFEQTDDVSEALNDYLQKTWDFLMEITPDKKALFFLIVRNDFHNLKASLKALVNDLEPSGYFLTPSVLEPESIFEAVKNKQFDFLPGWISSAAAQGYDLLISTMDGQLLDAFLDRKALQVMIAFAKESENETALRFADVFVSLANIKIALRAARSGKGEVLLEEAFCPCESLDVEALKRAAIKGKEEVISFLDSSKFASLVAAAQESMAAFEKESDNYLLTILDEARYVSFGIEPLIAYYYAREMEQKLLRIIVSGKHIGLSSEEIKERMREVYV